MSYMKCVGFVEGTSHVCVCELVFLLKEYLSLIC